MDKKKIQIYTIIKGIKETSEYKENCAYNNVVRDTLFIIKNILSEGE